MTPLEPKVIDHPGAGKIREQSLDEFVSVLAPEHLARQQLNEIRGQALKAVEFSTQLMQANEKILELQKRLMTPTPTVPQVHFGDPPGTVGVLSSPPQHELVAPPNKYQPAPDLVPVTPQEEAVAQQLMQAKGLSPLTVEYPDAKCPHCGEVVSTRPGTWGMHQARKHPDNRAPRPTV